MNWREERRLLNECLAKHHLISERGQRVITRAARTVRKRKAAEANKRWRRENWIGYQMVLRRRKAARARKQKESPLPRKERKLAQHAAICAFFLSEK